MRALARSLCRPLAPAFALILCATAHATSKTYLLNFGSKGANSYTASDTTNGDINYLDGAQNGTGFGVDQVIPIVGGNNAVGQTFTFGNYTLTMTSAYAAYNIRNSSSNNTAVYGTFFLAHGQTPVSFSISGLNPADVVSISFLSSQAWAVQVTASTTSDFSGNAITASSSAKPITNTTPFTPIRGSLTGSPTIYAQFVAANHSGREGDLSGMIINITSGSPTSPASSASVVPATSASTLPTPTIPKPAATSSPATTEPVSTTPSSASSIPEPSAYTR